MTIQKQDIESELSYAYLHAVASKAGFACQVTNRLSDKSSIDAEVRVLERMTNDSILTDFMIDIQLKATYKKLNINNKNYSFSLPINQYDNLRAEGSSNQKLLVVLSLPTDESEWLSCNEEELVLKRCAYWVSLRGARTIDNSTSITIYIPKANLFSHESLREIASIRSREEYVLYAQ